MRKPFWGDVPKVEKREHPNAGPAPAIGLRRIGKVDVAVLDQPEALALVVNDIAAGTPNLICFANAHTVNTANRSEQFLVSISRALVLNDGVGLNLASRWLYARPFPANLNGTDFTPQVIAALPPGARLFLLGGAPGIANEAAKAIIAANRQIVVVGTQDGFFAPEEEDALAHRITLLKVDLVLVGMGHPRQELWAAKYFENLGATVMCIGALLDFYAGAVPRAPRWVRSAKMEWAFRLACEPRRLARRYLLGNFAFLLHVAASRPVASTKAIVPKAGLPID